MRENEKVNLHSLDEHRISVFCFIHLGFIYSGVKRNMTLKKVNWLYRILKSLINEQSDAQCVLMPVCQCLLDGWKLLHKESF